MAAGLATKVDKVEGKVLSTNDFTTAEKQRVAAAALASDVAEDWSNLRHLMPFEKHHQDSDVFLQNKLVLEHGHQAILICKTRGSFGVTIDYGGSYEEVVLTTEGLQ